MFNGKLRGLAMSKKDLPLVEVIASGYEWTCPECDELNKEIEYRGVYTCQNCGREVEADSPEHAYY